MLEHRLKEQIAQPADRFVNRQVLRDGLFGLGAQARLNQLVKANPDDAEAIYNAAQRLIDPKDMGERFKAICLSSQGLPAPAGF